MTINKLRRKFGFGSDHAGIISRYLNEEKNWFEHLNNTKRIILENTHEKNKNICMIIGSGWCLDVPAEELSKMFNKVFLVDIIHPRQVVHKMKKFPNVEFLTLDISGFLEPLYQYKRTYQRNVYLYELLNKHDEISFIKKYNPDFVVSVNILSQLAFFPDKYIERYGLSSKKEQSLIRELIEKRHLEILPEGKSVLITDYYESEYNLNGNFIRGRERLSVPLPKEKIIKEWVWDFDLSGNYYTGNPVKFKVAALQV